MKTTPASASRDRLSQQRRSWNMSRIRSKDTTPELLVRSALHKQGYRFRLHDPKLPGRPDVVLKRFKTVLFVHGCFWHQHKGCIDCSKPRANSGYWNQKLRNNVKRDIRNRRAIGRAGWRAVVVWECVARSPHKLQSLISRVFQKHHSQKLNKPAKTRVTNNESISHRNLRRRRRSSARFRNGRISPRGSS